MQQSSSIQSAIKYRIAGLLIFSFLLAFFVSFALGTKRQTLSLHLQVNTAQQSIIQLFYDLGQGFTEELSQQRSVSTTGKKVVVRFTLPPHVIKSLRIDFVSPDQKMQIAAISLVNDMNQVPYQYDIHRLSALQDIESIRFHDNIARIIANGPDPQLLLGLDSPVVNAYGFQWRLFFSLTFVAYSALWLVLRLFCLLFSRFDPSRRGLCKGELEGKTRILHLVMVIGGLSLLGALSIFLVHEKGPALNRYEQGHQVVSFKEIVAGKQVTLKRADGLNIAGTIYNPQSGRKMAQGVLLLHGNYPEGRNFPLYPVLAQSLGQKGYIVLTIDFAGYGASGDPLVFGRLESVDMDMETGAALRFLRDLPGLDRQAGVIIMGHSMGADSALSVGVEDSIVGSIVLIGPPRRVQERFHFPPDRNFFWNWAHYTRKKVYGKEGFPDWYGMEEWLQQILERDMVKFLPYFAQWQHKPLLLIDGEREPGPDKAFLQKYFCRTAYPKKYVTLVKADHNCNVSARGEQVMYDPVVMQQLVEEIDSWNHQSETVGQALYDWLGNILRWLFAIDVIQDC